MIFKNTIYIDSTRSTSGDGLSPTTALNSLPNFADMLNDTQYVIRRGSTLPLNGTIEQYTWDVNSITGSGVNNTIEKFGLIGVPKSTDPASKQLPSELYTIWVDDDKDDPTITVDINNMYLSTSVYDFELRNIKIIKRDNHNNYEYERCQYSGTTSVFNFIHGNTPLKNTNYYGSYSFFNCRFDGDESKTNISENNENFEFGVATDYINLGVDSFVSNVTIAKCYIKHTPVITDGGYCGSAFILGYPTCNCNITNNEIHSVTSGQDEYYIPDYRHSVFYYYAPDNNTIYGERTLNFSDNNYYIHRSNHIYYIPLLSNQRNNFDFKSPWLNIISKNIKISDISEGLLGTIQHITNSESLIVTSYMLNYGSTYNCDISNIMVELTDCKYIYNGGIIRCICPQQQYSYDNSDTFNNRMMGKNVSNINVKLANVDQGVCNSTIRYRNSASNESNYLYSWNYNYGCINVTGIVLNNINITNYYGKSITANACTFVGNNDLLGVVHLRDSVGYINNIKTDLPYGAVKYWGYGSTIQIDNIELNKEQTKFNNYNSIEFENQYTFYHTTTQINKMNVLCHSIGPWYNYDGSYRTDSPTAGGCITVLNDDNKSGRFNLYSSYGNVTTWSASRINGSSNVLKITNTLQAVQDHIIIGKYPSNIILSQCDADGSYKIVLYFAHTGYDNMNNEILNLTLYDETKSNFWTSSTYGGIEDDDSEWVGTGDDTKVKRICMYIDNVKTGKLYGRIDFRGYDSSGAIFIDPVLSVIKID